MTKAHLAGKVRLEAVTAESYRLKPAHLRAILDHAPMAVLLRDMDSRIVLTRLQQLARGDHWPR
jgi:hypothetical protein